jgi:hypothetical protein
VPDEAQFPALRYNALDDTDYASQGPGQHGLQVHNLPKQRRPILVADVGDALPRKESIRGSHVSGMKSSRQPWPSKGRKKRLRGDRDVLGASGLRAVTGDRCTATRVASAAVCHAG